MAFGMGELQYVLADTTLAEEATSSNTADIHIPVSGQIEEVGLLVAVKLGNTITTASGVEFVRLSGAAHATVTTLATIDFSAASTSELGFKFGDGAKVGQTAILGTYTFDVGEVIVQKLTTTGQAASVVSPGDKIRVRGTTTGGSATGDFRPFVAIRVAGIDFRSARVASPHVAPGTVSGAVDS